MIGQQEQGHTITLLPGPDGAKWLCLDLETGDAPENAIAAAIDAWKAPSNWKQETVESKRAEYAEKVREKAALLDASPILCVGMRSPTFAMMFSSMGAGHLDEILGWTAVQESDDEMEMLVCLGQLLNLITSDATVLVGHNVRAFDLPKLRGAYVRNRLPLPYCLRPRIDGPEQPVTDTAKLFRHFSMEHRDDFAVSLDTACRAFGIPRPKEHMSGADVPRMHSEGRYAEILTYCAIDCDATAELYRLMMA